MKIAKILFLIMLSTSVAHANDSYFSEAVILFEKKKFDKAKFKFEQDLIFNPKSEKSYLYLSKIFNIKKKKKLEEYNLDTVILLNPKNEEATYSLAKLKLEESNYSESNKLNDRLLIFCKQYCQKSKKLQIEIQNSLKK